MLRVACVHLFNDYSGSPAVLANAVKGLLKQNCDTTIITSRSEGKLSDIPGAHYNYIHYEFYESKILRLILFLWAQIQLFFKVFALKNGTIVYVNTVLPFGAALGAWITGKKVIYHMHESSVKPPSLKNLLFSVANLTASKAIYVSRFLMDKEPLSNVDSEVVYNALKPELANSLYALPDADPKLKNILLICSLKDYKGIPEFIKLSNTLNEYTFTLVVNASLAELAEYLKNHPHNKNLRCFPRQKNLIPFYKEASIVVNMSRVDEWLETFGLTILEGMTGGRPVIGQTVGGTAELINFGEYGYCIDCKISSQLIKVIKNLHEDRSLYLRMSELARSRSRDFSITNQQKHILSIVFDLETNNKSMATSYVNINK